MNPTLRCLPPLLLLATLSAADALPPPTQDEAALLGFANAHRSQRWQYDPVIVKLLPKNMPDGTSVLGYCKSYFKPMRQLVHSPPLAAAARALLASGANMPEGALPDAAAAQSGYPAGAKTAATIVRGAASIEAAYAGSLQFWCGTNSGRKVISFQTVLTTPWQEAGVAISRGAKGIDAVVVYGMGGAARVAGGAVYADANRDLAYDAAEGVVGVVVTCGGASMTTGPGGVWWMTLPDAGAGSVTFATAGIKATRTIEAGNDSGIFWRVPPADELKQVDTAIAAAKSAAAGRKPDSDNWPAAMVDLHMRILFLDLDSARQEQVATLIQPLADEFDSMRRRYLADLDGDAKAFSQRLNKDRTRYPGTASRWFKELQTMAALRRQVVAAGAATEPGKIPPALWEELAKARAASCDPVFRRQYEGWEQQLGPPPAAAPPKPSKR